MAQDAQKGGMRRGIKWVLGLSLAFNLLVLGAVGGAAFRHMGDGPKRWDRGGGPSVQAYGAPYMRALPPEARRMVNEALREGRRSLPSRAERKADFAQILTLLRSNPLDEDAVQAVFAKQRQSALDVQAAAQGHWLKVVQEMSAEERATLADRLETALKRGPRKPGKKNGS